MKRRSVALFGSCLLMAAGAAAQTKPTAWTAPSGEQVNAIYPDVETLYLDLHRNPELSLHEQQTAAKLAERMKALGYEVTTGVGGTGVVAVLRNGRGPTVLLRTDMDALPVEEKTGLPYASQIRVKSDSGTTVPVMHACGHDVHMSSWFGTAKLMATNRPTGRRDRRGRSRHAQRRPVHALSRSPTSRSPSTTTPVCLPVRSATHPAIPWPRRIRWTSPSSGAVATARNRRTRLILS